MATCPNLERLISSLPGSGYEVTSPASGDYNCIAWAAEETDRWWWPQAPDDAFWPAAAPDACTVEAFEAAFSTLGYQSCEGAEVEPGFTKVAVYVGPDGAVTHMARQLPDGSWTSKCGSHKDIRHLRLEDIGSCYGVVSKVLRRAAGSAS
jgi:hypothetical protein